MAYQGVEGAPPEIAAMIGSEHEVELDMPKPLVDVIADQGIDFNLEPREFLRKLFESNGRVISEDEITLILNQYTVVPYAPSASDGENLGDGLAQAPSVGRLSDGRRIQVVRRTNRNRKLENLNMSGAIFTASEESKAFKDAAGLGPVKDAEKMNLEVGENLPALAFGSAHSVFHNSAESALDTMKQHALVTAALLLRLNTNIQKAEALLSSQKQAMFIEASATGTAVGPVPMTGSMRALMNQNKMLLETYAVGVSGWLSGIYLPKITACLMTAATRPQSRVKCQTLLAKLDSLLSTLQDDKDVTDEMLDELDATHAAVYAEIRRAGLTASLTKQMRGGFSSFQKREDHQHAVFVTASLREELYYFIATAPMNVGRRTTLQQYPLPRLLVAAERFLDSDVCGTVDAFRSADGHIHALVPPDVHAGAFSADQFDTGGSIQNITAKTIRPEKTGSGVTEAEEALSSSSKTQEQRHGELVAKAWEQLRAADGSSVVLNVAMSHRDNEDRASLREFATQRGRVSTTEEADFVRSGNFVYLTEKAPAGFPRTPLSKDARVSPHSGVHAPAVTVLNPERPAWIQGVLPSAELAARVGAMAASRAPLSFPHHVDASAAHVDASAAHVDASAAHVDASAALIDASAALIDASASGAGDTAPSCGAGDGDGSGTGTLVPLEDDVNGKRTRHVAFREEEEEKAASLAAEEEEAPKDRSNVKKARRGPLKRKAVESSEETDKATSSSRQKPTAPPPSAEEPEVSKPRRRRMKSTLGVQDEDEADIPAATAPAASRQTLQLSPRSQRKWKNNGGAPQVFGSPRPPSFKNVSGRSVPSLIPPLPARPDAVIPSLLSDGLPSIFRVGVVDGLPSMFPGLGAGAAIGSLAAPFGSLGPLGSLAPAGSHALPLTFNDSGLKSSVNKTMVSNLQSFANKRRITSDMLSAFVDTFRSETDGQEDGEADALGDDI